MGSPGSLPSPPNPTHPYTPSPPPQTFAYTNHTILPEALEKWSVELLGSLLPRHLEIIYKINWHFLEEVRAAFGDDSERVRTMSIVEEGHPKCVRMAHLAMVGSHTTNGVAAIHTELVKSVVFPSFFEMFPERFQNKTNGVTPRRWINQCNPRLAGIISKWLDTDEWLKRMELLRGLQPVADHVGLVRGGGAGGCLSRLSVLVVVLSPLCARLSPHGVGWWCCCSSAPLAFVWEVVLSPLLFASRLPVRLVALSSLCSPAPFSPQSPYSPPPQHGEWQSMKLQAKARLASHIASACHVAVRADALFDVQVKRIHEYKRQQMNALYLIHRYRCIKAMSPEQRRAVVPRVSIFGGKAAPGYDMAKRIIRLIHRIGAVVNSDPDVGDLFKVVFIPNYNVSLAELIVPASDLSQHISTAGMEASGTSNMKFAMNGGLIIGTMDGANIEIAAEIDRECMFIFGAESHEVPGLRMARKTEAPTPPCPQLAAVLEDLASGLYGPAEEVAPLLATLRWENDYYLVAHDFPSYCAAQEAADACFARPAEWTRRSIISTSGMAKFSTDRTMDEYARDIWRIAPCRRSEPVTDNMGRTRSFPSLMPGALGAPEHTSTMR